MAASRFRLAAALVTGAALAPAALSASSCANVFGISKTELVPGNWECVGESSTPASTPASVRISFRTSVSGVSEANVDDLRVVICPSTFNELCNGAIAGSLKDFAAGHDVPIGPQGFTGYVELSGDVKVPGADGGGAVAIEPLRWVYSWPRRSAFVVDSLLVPSDGWTKFVSERLDASADASAGTAHVTFSVVDCAGNPARGATLNLEFVPPGALFYDTAKTTAESQFAPSPPEPSTGVTGRGAFLGVGLGSARLTAHHPQIGEIDWAAFNVRATGITTVVLAPESNTFGR